MHLVQKKAPKVKTKSDTNGNNFLPGFSPVKYGTKGNNDIETKGDIFIQHCYSLFIYYLIRDVQLLCSSE